MDNEISELEKDLNECIEEIGIVIAMYSVSQELVRVKNPDSEETRLLNIIVGTSFALFQAAQRYKEIKNGKSIKHRSGIKNSKNGSRLS